MRSCFGPACAWPGSRLFTEAQDLIFYKVEQIINACLHESLMHVFIFIFPKVAAIQRETCCDAPSPSPLTRRD